MKQLLFSTSGIPRSTSHPATTTDGIREVRRLGLDGMELEFVRGVHIKKEKSGEVKKVSISENVHLTCHAPYYINLNSNEAAKVRKSQHWVLLSARIAWFCGATSLAFHPGFYMKMDKGKVYQNIKSNLKPIVEELRTEGVLIDIRPETTGKLSQFASLDEVLGLSQEIEGVKPCIDFAHLHAKSAGKLNTRQDFSGVLEKVEKSLGKDALNDMHIHVSGISYGLKGEREHLPLQKSTLDYKALLQAWKDFNISGIVVSESPLNEEDALLLKRMWKTD